MIKELSGLPTGVIGFEATGELKAEDYRDVILPALERAAAGGDVRFVVVIPESTGCPAVPCGRTSRWGSSTCGRGSGSPGHRHRVDGPHDHVVRVDDTR
jgi:hypothetical protein